MSIYQIEKGYWIAEGRYLGRFIIVEGTTRKDAKEGWMNLLEGNLSTIKEPARAPIPTKPRQIRSEHEEAPATSYSEGEQALEELYAREGR